MKKEQIFYIPVWTKKYPLIITDTGKIDKEDWELVHIVCDIIHLDQDYLKIDLPVFLMDISSMIEEELSQKSKENIHIRLKPSEKRLIEKKAQLAWFNSLSDFVKAKCMA